MKSDRYLRQTILPEFGLVGQKILKESRVLCVGSGGLGSPALLYLAAAGVGKIGIIDPDIVATSNLQRQILFRTQDDGSGKAQVAHDTLLELNPEIVVEAYSEAFTNHNALSLLKNYDLVIDGSDNFSTKYLINDAAYIASIPMVYGSVSAFEGQVAIFSSRTSSCYRCLHPAEPLTSIQNCAEGGVLGSIVGTIGTLQATLALQFLLSQNNEQHPLRPKSGNLTVFDFRGMWSIRNLHIPKSLNCPTCSKKPNELQLQYTPDFCKVDTIISIDELKKILGTESAPLLIDVREKEELVNGHIPGSLHWPLSQIESDPTLGPQELNNQKSIVLYCTAGIRSAKAALILSQHRSLRCRSLQGGLLSST